jgi:pyrroloquinoline-quinone synthase
MRLSDCKLDIAAVLVDRRLLDHPFYRRWESGGVSMEELASYAAQYRHFERFLPTFLRTLIAGLPEGSGRDLVAANLADEEGDPIPHVELFERFASAVGANVEKASPAMSNLLGCYEQLLVHGPFAALAGFAAYESQAGDVARRKADGLRHDHGLDDEAVSFWEHHAAVDVRHGAWVQESLEEAGDSAATLLAFARRAADGWWAFLDERESVAQAS